MQGRLALRRHMGVVAVVGLACVATAQPPGEQEPPKSGPVLRMVPIDAMPGGAPANPELARELGAMLARDQGVRARVASLDPHLGLPFPEPFLDEWREADETNTRRLREIIAEHGWPGISLVGPQGALAAFLIVQHADLETQQELLPLLEAAGERGEVTRSQLVYLVDRVRLRTGRPQVYGTQVTLDAQGRYVAETLEDPEGVDARRAQVGLPPLQQYLDMMSSRSTPPTQGERAPTHPALRDRLLEAHQAFQTNAPFRHAQGGWDVTQWPADVRAQREAAVAEMEAILRDVLETHGYPTPSMVGADGARAVFMMAAGATLALQERVLDRMAEAQDTPPAHHAWLTDKVRVARGEPQRFGTQFRRDADGRIVPHAIEDEAGVEDRRARAGLSSLSQTLTALNNA